MIDVKIKLINEDAKLPEYKTSGAACADVYSPSEVLVPGYSKVIIPLGFQLEIPEGYEIQVRPRSGLAAKNGITVLNTPGCLDSDFRGEVGVIIINTSNEPFLVNKGDRICQFKLSEVPIANWIIVNKLSDTDRGTGGFGSTGR